MSRTFHIRIPDKTTKHDSSGEICDRFASEDSRIHVIHKQNTGVSDSRNIAIDQAKGTYLQFLDSDDWITPNATGLLVQSAQQVPIYYYVKTKGSLASQGMSISKTIKMKLMVFEYYNNFYKHVMNDEDYEKNKLQVYRFLIDAAGDGAVPPAILPGSKKLGEERNQISSEAISSEGFLMDEYRNRKLLDYYLEPIAMKNDMTLNEARLLLYLNQPHHCTTRRELADFTNMSQHTLSMLLQKLSAKGLLKVETIRSKKQINILFLPVAAPILREIADAQNSYDRARYESFTEEELVQYAYYTDKIKQNIQKIL